MLRWILFSLLITISFGCQKTYEEGPRLTFRKIENRIASGWNLESLLVDGSEKIHEFTDSIGYSQFWFWKYKKEQDFSLDNGAPPGRWSISQDKKRLIIWYSPSVPSYGPFFFNPNAEMQFKIIRLDNEICKLSAEHLLSEYILTMRKAH